MAQNTDALALASSAPVTPAGQTTSPSCVLSLAEAWTSALPRAVLVVLDTSVQSQLLHIQRPVATGWVPKP